jgi:hypothetical protein
MTKQDFFNLRLEQVLYFNGIPHKISCLSYYNDIPKIMFSDLCCLYDWFDIMGQCSLTK